MAITVAIEGLAKEPRPHGYKKLKGAKEHIYRIRVGNYRVIYNLDDIIRVVNVRNIGNRKKSMTRTDGLYSIYLNCIVISKTKAFEKDHTISEFG